ncbi:MAG: hypothetical protein ACM3MG_02915 [Bacillota bacterium]
MAMDIEPEVRREERRRREQEAPSAVNHEQVEGMTERPFKTHDIDRSPLRVFGVAVAALLVAGAFVGLIYWVFSRATGGG